jgi:hypothetical protein
MLAMKPRNDRALALSAFCLEIETYRRTVEGRARDAKAFLGFYFARGRGSAATVDRLFSHLPRAVRAPIIAGWRVRGLKAALRDDDDRVRAVVEDALEAGDIDATMFESGVPPEVLVDYVPLDEWWQFWRGAALPTASVQKALAAARALRLVDDAWFLGAVEGRAGKVKGTDAVADTLTKDEIIAWVRALHASGDASPAGIVAARGWENILAKTAPEALLVALDAFARKMNLVKADSVVPPRPLSMAPLHGFEDMPPVDLSKVDADASAWGDEGPPPFSEPGEAVGDDELEHVPTPHLPPPLPE